MLSWRLTNLACETIGYFDQRPPGSNVIWPHCDKRRATLIVSLEDPLVPHVSALKTGLYCELNGMPLFHGPCLDPVMRGAEGVMEIPAVDAAEWLERGIHLEDRIYSGAQENSAFEALYERIHEYDYIPGKDAYLHRIILSEDTLFTVDRVLEMKEGAPYWQVFTDLRDLAEGLEFSFDPLPPDELYPLEPESFNPRNCAAWAAFRGGQIITATGETELPIGVPDPSRRPIFDPGSIVTPSPYPTADILRGDDTPVPSGIPEFQFGFGQDNAQDMSYGPSGTSVKNFFRAVGQAPENGVPARTTLSNIQSIKEFGSWAGFESVNYTNPEAVAAYAQQQLAAYKVPPQAFTVVPAMEWMSMRDGHKYGFPPEFMKEYGPGNMISAEGQFGRIRQRVIGRVTQATVTEMDAHGNVKVDLTCIPRVLA